MNGGALKGTGPLPKRGPLPTESLYAMAKGQPKKVRKKIVLFFSMIVVVVVVV